MQSLRCLLAMMALVEVSVAADGGRLAVRSEESPVAIRRLPPIDRDTSRRLRRAEQPVNHSRFALASYHKDIGTHQPRYERRSPLVPLPLTNTDSIRQTYAANPLPIRRHRGTNPQHHQPTPSERHGSPSPLERNDAAVAHVPHKVHSQPINLASRCVDLDGDSIFDMYYSTRNGRGVWRDINDFSGRPAVTWDVYRGALTGGSNFHGPERRRTKPNM